MDEKDFMIVRNSAPFNEALALLRKKNCEYVFPEYDSPYVTYGNTKMINKDGNMINPSVVRLLLYMTHIATMDGFNNDEYDFKIKDYFDLRAITSSTYSRNQLKEDIDTLLELQFVYEQSYIVSKNQTKKTNFYKFSLEDISCPSNRYVRFRFGEDWTKMMMGFKNKRSFIYFPRKIFSINDKDRPYSFLLMYKFLVDRCSNFNNKKRNKNGVFKLGIPSLLESASFPIKRELFVKGGYRYSTILKVFLDNMKEVEEYLSWSWGESLVGDVENHIESPAPETYDKFIKSYIYYKITNIPSTDNE